MDIEQVMKKFEDYCNPKKNILHERFKFYNRRQVEGETFDNFVTDVKTLVQGCEFKNVDEILRDKIVLFSCDKDTRDRIIKMGIIDLEEAVQQFRLAEIQRTQLRQMESNSAHEIVRCERNSFSNRARNQDNGKMPVNQHKKTFNNPKAATNYSKNNSRYKNGYFKNGNTPVLCSKCGLKHADKKCPAEGRLCYKCNKPNHFSSVCKSKIQVISKEFQYVSHDDDEYFCNQLNGGNSRGWMQKINIENSNVNFKLDSGADVNVIPMFIFNKIRSESKKYYKINRNTICLKAYNESNIETVGQVYLSVFVKGVSYMIKFIIVAGDLNPIMGLETCEKLGLISKNEINTIQLNLSKEQIINNYVDVFEGIGCFPTTVSIKLKEGTVPTSKPPSRVPLKLHGILKNELDRLCKEEIICKVERPTEWVHKLVIVEKNDGSIRICLDPRDLNKCIVRQYFSIPTIQELSSKVSKANFFCVLDLKDSFWHVRLDERSSNYCTFGTIFGTYKFNRLPFGLNISAEVFSQENYKVFGDIENLFIYVDDLLIYAETEEEMNAILLKVLERARKFNIKFNLKKFKYNVKSVKYLGQIFENGSMRPDKDRINAILEYVTPKDKKDLQRFLGLINYLRDYIPNLAELSQPLRELLKQANEFVWSENHNKCLKKLKDALVSPPVLQNYDKDKEVVIQTDSSKDAIGCVLLQEGKPVCYASKSLSDTETRYAQIEKEFLAVLFSCKKFHQYIYGRKLVIQTDHLPLLTIMKKDINSIPSRRLQCIKLKLAIYDFELQYISGKKMLIADAISRACIKQNNSDQLDVDIDVSNVIHTINVSCDIKKEFQTETDKDQTLKKVMDCVQNKWDDKKDIPEAIKLFYNIRDQLNVDSGLLFFGEKIVVPNSLIGRILEKLHESHIGVTKTKARAKNLFYWKGMNKDIENFILRCKICEKFRPENCREPMITQECPEYPFKKVSCDILEFGGKNYLVTMDYFSRWLELEQIGSKNSRTVIQTLKSIFSRYGVPEVLISDNMPFGSMEFYSFSKEWNFKTITSSPRYPRSNGLAEKGVDIAKRMLKKSKESNVELELMLLEYRSSPVIGSKYSPSELLMSRLLRTKLPVFNNKVFKPRIEKGFKQYSDERSFKVKKYYDNKCKKEKNFEIGDNVTVWDENRKTWEPAVIIDKHSTPRSYWIKDSKNMVKRRNTFHLRKSFNPVVNNNNDNNEGFYNKKHVNMPKYQKWYDDCKGGNGLHIEKKKGRIKDPVNEDISNEHLHRNTESVHKGENQYATRSGRTVKRPARYD